MGHGHNNGQNTIKATWYSIISSTKKDKKKNIPASIADMIGILVFYDTEYHTADDNKLDCMLSRILKKYPCLYV